MPALTRLQLQTRVSELINDTTNSQWTAAQIQERIQEAQETFVEDTHCLISTTPLTVVSGTRTYTLTSTYVLDIIRVSMSPYGVLRRVGEYDLDQMYPGQDYSLVTGQPQYYFYDATGTTNLLTLFPIPTAAYNGLTLSVQYIVEPTAMSSDSDLPFNSQVALNPYISAIAYNTAAQLLVADNDPNKRTKAKDYIDFYKQSVSECIETFNALRETTPMRMRGGRYFKGL